MISIPALERAREEAMTDTPETKIEAPIPIFRDDTGALHLALTMQAARIAELEAELSDQKFAAKVTSEFYQDEIGELKAEIARLRWQLKNCDNPDVIKPDTGE